MADEHTRATAYDEWMAAKSELRIRGYDVWESFDQKQNAYIADCSKRPNGSELNCTGTLAHESLRLFLSSF
jgi:hypothetical protein